MVQLTAGQEIKIEIILRAMESDNSITFNPNSTAEEIDRFYDEDRWDYDSIQDSEYQFRESFSEETYIPCEHSRHYESMSVAKKIGGKWIGWTYWYGGGKFGEPNAVDWIDEAYFLKVEKEEEKTVIERTFSKLT